MTPVALLERAVRALRAVDCRFALAGGLAASFYRAKPRLTNDVDIAILSHNKEQTSEIGVKVLEQLGCTVSYGWIANAVDKLPQSVALLIGQIGNSPEYGTIDFLLPTFPWLENAMSRAEHNLIDFGFARIPTLTPEDLIIAKTFALSIEPNRFTDLDDLHSIFSQENYLDLVYLAAELTRLELMLPKTLTAVLPEELKQFILG